MAQEEMKINTTHTNLHFRKKKNSRIYEPLGKFSVIHVR